MAYNNRGETYGQLGEYKRAIQDYDEAIRLNPQLASASMSAFWRVAAGNRGGGLDVGVGIDVS